MVDCILLYVIAIKEEEQEQEEEKKRRLICKGIIVQITSTFKKYKSIRKRRLDPSTSSRYMLTPSFFLYIKKSVRRILITLSHTTLNETIDNS